MAPGGAGRGPAFLATAARGTEGVVARELEALGFAGVKAQHGGVRFTGASLADAWRACLHLRAAMRVLWPLGTFPAGDDAALYEGARALPWEAHLTATSTFAVSATTRAAPPLAHGAHLALRVKDAVADRLRDHFGARPDVSKDDPDVRIYVHVEAAARSKGGVPAVTIGLDVSGDSLHARGYRVADTAAPLRESLAAALVLLSGWDGQSGRPFVDPMCGSGTLAIEAALIAARVAPGRVGRTDRFGFLRWPTFGDAERAAWRELCAAADAAARPRAPGPIVAGDRDDDALAAARANARAAGSAVAASLSFRHADARELPATTPPGLIMANPPYGERLGGRRDAGGEHGGGGGEHGGGGGERRVAERGGRSVGPAGGLEPFWRAFGQRLRTLDGHTACILIPDGPATDWLAMRPVQRHALMNGPIPVSLCRYELRGRS